MSNVVRKKGSPNRGGGRGSKPRGGHRGGQGQGQGGGKSQRSSGFAAETGARKGNFDYLDDDFVLMPRESTDRNTRTGSKASSGRGSLGSGRQQGRGNEGTHQGRGNDGNRGRGNDGNRERGNDGNRGRGNDGYRGRGNDGNHGRGRGEVRGRGRGEPRKVQMQQLCMTTENQELVRDVLRELQGSEPSEISEQGYDELGNQSDARFWTQDKSMVLEGATGFHEDNENCSQEELVNKYALLKLLKYGFHRDHCLAAIEESNGDVGQALEHLLQECFHFSPKHKRKRTKSRGEGETNGATQEALQQREEEAMALSSIYQEDFEERIPNRVWVMNFDLPHVSDHYLEKARSLQDRKQQMVDRSLSAVGVCRFYQQGHCRFGSKCKFRHKREGQSKAYQEICDNASAQVYQLEIRFPEGNLYPMEPPLVAFLTSNPDFPVGKSINVSKLLFEEAKEIAECASPVVFSLVSILEDAPRMVKTLEQKPLPLSLAPSTAKPVENKPAFKQGAGRGRPHNAATNNSTSVKGKDLANLTIGRDDSENSDSTDEEGSSSSEIESEPAPVKVERNQPMKRDRRAIERENRILKEQFRKKKHSHSYKSFLEDRQKLPAWKEQETILKSLDKNQVVVVSGMTGCGKTTQVPQFILDASLKTPGPLLCNIICTQPRRISAMAVADRVANERAVRLGGVVGYQIRLESKQSASTRLLFCTTGILLRRMEGDFNLDGVSHIIVDEVHERSEESDFLMMVLRDILPKRKDLRVLLMSATLNADLFSSYFDGCPVINIPGKTFPVEQFFLEDAIEWTNYKLEENSTYSRPLKRSNAATSDGTAKQLKTYQYGGVEDEIEEALASTAIKPAKENIRDWNLTIQQLALRYSDYSKSTIKVVGTMDAEKINNDLIEELVSWVVFGDHEYSKNGAILIFLPGLAEILSCYEQLQSSLCGPRAKKRFKLVPLHSSLSNEEQNSAFLKPPEGVTKVVIATNIAETSITIDDIVYVIDAGKMKEKRYDSAKGMESLETTWVSRANALQRRGRAGRVTEGVCFHLYTANTYQNHLRDQPIPEIQRIPLEQLVLRIKILDLFKGISLQAVLSNLLEPPPISNTQDAILRLQNLGALDKDEGLTSLGYHLASLPVDVRIGKLMLFGAIFRCLDPVLTIAASLSFKSPFVAPFDKRDQADKKKLEFAIGNSDHLTLLRAYKGWTTCIERGSYNGYRYCHENFLSTKTLQMIASMKHQFAELLSSIGFIKEGLNSKMMDRKTGGNGDAVIKMCGSEANSNADNSRLVLAVLCAALYPNVVQVMTPESKYSQTSAGAVPKAPRPEHIRFKTKDEGYISIHPSSVNFQVRHYESPYLVFHEKIKTSKVYIRDCSMVSVYPLLLFGGCELSINLDRGRFIISLDEGWIRFSVATVEVAELVRELRLELDQLLQDKIQQPNMDLCTCPRGSRIITAIVQLITTQ